VAAAAAVAAAVAEAVAEAVRRHAALRRPALRRQPSGSASAT